MPKGSDLFQYTPINLSERYRIVSPAILGGKCVLPHLKSRLTSYVAWYMIITYTALLPAVISDVIAF